LEDGAITLAVISILIGFGSLLVLRSPKDEFKRKEDPIKFRDFRTLFSYPSIWLLAVSNLLMVGSLEGFADVWGVSYLMKAYDLNKGDAAGIVSFIFFGMLFGGPLLAFLSKKFGSYLVIAACGVGMALAFVLLFLTPIYNGWVLSILFFVIGIMCCYQVIVFAAGSELVSYQYLGVTIAFLNCINMLGGSFFHTLIGKVMDIYWTGAMGEDGVKHYSLEVYQYALSLIPICAMIGAIIVCIVGIRIRSTDRRVVSRS